MTPNPKTSPVRAAASERSTAPPPRPVSRVVIPVGGDDEEYLAQEQAVLFAAALEVPLLALHVTDDLESVPESIFGFVQKQGERWGVQLNTAVVPGSDLAAVLLGEIDALDLVVVGTRRLGTRFHLGSIAERLVNESPGPVQVVRLRGPVHRPVARPESVSHGQEKEA